MSDVIEFRPNAGASGVIATPTHEEITHALRECHSESLLAVIRGGFGVGKTHTLERYVAAHECDAAMVTFSPSTRSLTAGLGAACKAVGQLRSEEHTSELQPLMPISYAVLRLKKQNEIQRTINVAYAIRLNTKARDST